MLQPFAPDAIFLDNGRQFQGHTQLRTLLAEEVVAAKAIWTPDTVRHDGAQIVVEGPAHGNFPGSPIRFTYRFTLESDQIKTLEVTG
jgi:alkanesulfonate monooxygenase SsuD/methylene tetrahydromethanopterin reductase-like flavin-dependent oxidoreductase (luciferase family)